MQNDSGAPLIILPDQRVDGIADKPQSEMTVVIARARIAAVRPATAEKSREATTERELMGLSFNTSDCHFLDNGENHCFMASPIGRVQKKRAGLADPPLISECGGIKLQTGHLPGVQTAAIPVYIGIARSDSPQGCIVA